MSLTWTCIEMPRSEEENRGVVVNNLSGLQPSLYLISPQHTHTHTMSNTIQFLPRHQLGVTRSSKCLFSEWPWGVMLFSLSAFINLSTEVCSLIQILGETPKLDFLFSFFPQVSLLLWHMLNSLFHRGGKTKCLLWSVTGNILPWANNNFSNCICLFFSFRCPHPPRFKSPSALMVMAGRNCLSRDAEQQSGRGQKVQHTLCVCVCVCVCVFVFRWMTRVTQRSTMGKCNNIFGLSLCYPTLLHCLQLYLKKDIYIKQLTFF